MHRNYPFVGRLALGLFLLAASSATGRGAEYNGAGAPGLASPYASADLTSGGRVKLSQNDAARTVDDASAEEPRKRLKNELDRMRKGPDPRKAESKPAPPPQSAKPAKSKEPAPKATETPPAQPQKQDSAAIDAEINRAAAKLIIMRFSGSEPSDSGPKAVRGLMREGLIAGVLFGGDNIQSRSQLKELAKFYLEGSQQRKPLLAISEIGGPGGAFPAVKGFESWPTQRDVAAKGDPEYAYLTYRSLAAFLSGLGFNLNFGPSLGTERAAKEPSASFGDSPLQAGVFAKTFLLGHRDGNMVTVPVVDGSDLAVRALKTLLVPYPVMPVAVILTSESNPLPAYDGLIRGPRFCMIAVKQGNGPGEAASAFSRGCDVLVIDGGKESPAAIRDLAVRGVSDAIKKGSLSMESLTASAQRLSTLRSQSQAAASAFTTRTAQ